MEIIVKPNSFVKNALGKQQYKEGSSYRRFTYAILSKRNNEFLIANLLTREILALTEKEYSAILNSDFSEDKNLSEYLISEWFLVEENHNDKLTADQILRVFEAVSAKKPDLFTHYTVLPTTDCNARCFYCYEANVHKENMSENTAEAVADYIKRHSFNEKVTFRWFGGEPLCNKKAINTITSRLRENGIPFKSSIVTNGYLFTEDVIREAKEKWNVSFVQITLDGTEEVYNRCKNYVYTDSVSPYKTVLNNIKSLTEAEIFVNIRMNLDTHNYENLKILINELHGFLGDSKYYSMYVHLLFEDSGNLKLKYNESEKMLRFGQLRELEDIIHGKGLYFRTAFSDKPKIRSCMADDDSSIVILPDGKLCKCEHILYKETVGDIYSDELDYKAVESWKKRIAEFDKCRVCPLYPECIKLEKCIEDEKKCEASEQLYKIQNTEFAVWKKYDRIKAAETEP